MKIQAITLVKEDVLHLGRMVHGTVTELTRLLSKEPGASFSLIEANESDINDECLKIEERCMDILHERQDLSALEIRTLVGSTLMAVKFERLADHAHRVAKFVTWAAEDNIDLPQEMREMALVVNRMVEDVLVCYLSDSIAAVPEITQRDSHVDYMHDLLSKRLLSDLGVQDQEEAQRRTQFLFCTRYLERMGDCCASIAKRIHFIVTGERL